MADLWMNVDAALSEVPVNILPLTDDTDFKTREESVVYNQSGLDLVWNFVTTAGAFTQTAVTPTNTGGDYDWVNQGNGMYTIEIPASGGASINNDTEGFGWFTGFATGILPWRGPTIGFRSQTVNDALIASNTFVTTADLGILLESAITTVNSQTNFDLTEGIAVDDNWIGHQVVIEDASTGDFHETWITDVTATGNNIVINAAAGFTVTTSDTVRIYKNKHPRYELNNYDPPTRTEATTDVNTILAKLLDYVQLLARSDSAIATDNATALNEINTDEGSGAGTFDNTTDSLQNIDADVVTADGVIDTVNTNVSAVKTKTDQLNFGVANAVDANITNVAGSGDLQSSGTGGQGYGT